MDNLKEIIKNALVSMRDLTIIITSQDGYGHRYATADIGNRICIRRTNMYGHLCQIGILVSVKDAPQECLKQMQMDDYYECGCPHHFELSENQTEVLYVRHGTNAFGETGNMFVEQRYDKVWVYRSFKRNELHDLPRGETCYHESIERTIELAASAVNALVY